MKRGCKYLLNAFFFLCLILSSYAMYSQLPNCIGAKGGLIHYITNTTSTTPSKIYNYNPTLPKSSTNPSLNTIVPPVNANGLTVCKNFSGIGPSPTFYTTINGNYYYYDGTAWVNTGHSSGSMLAWNPGASNDAIYNIDVINKEVWKYNGTGNAVKLFSIPTYDGVADITTDCEGNFYLLRTNTGQNLEKYNASGVLIATYTLSGLPSAIGGGGIAIIGNKLYYDNVNSFFEATISGTNVNFTSITSPLLPQVQDFASCPFSANNIYADIDTVYYCGTGPAIKIKAIGNGPFTWSVLSGNAIITGTGDSVLTTATQTSRILLKGAAASSTCGSNTDTVTILVPTATIDAGQDHIVQGCSVYLDTLKGSLTNAMGGINYQILWQPPGDIIANINTLIPVLSPKADSKYYLKVSTSASQGNCSWIDSVSIILKDVTVVADFDTSVTKGCGANTAIFTDKSVNAVKYHWDFGDSQTDNKQNTSYVYNSNGQYKVVLIASNAYCSDTTFKDISIDLPPALKLYNVTTDIRIKYGDTLQLNADGAVSYMWFPETFLNNSNIKNPVARPYEPIKYVVEGVNEFGCKDSAVVHIDIDYTMKEYVPSAFSPNGDGLNDFFKILNIKYQKLLSFMVLNRFGEVVFQTTDSNKGWDGNYKGVPQDIGAYYYMIKVLIPNGEEHFYKGDVTLVR